MKINVGDYVRNKYGIARVIELSEDVANPIQIIKFDRDICFMVNPETGEERNRMNVLPITSNIDLNKIKFGKLIDLIEVGDYVNGRKVTKIHLDKTIDEKKRILCGDTAFDCLEEMYVNEDIVSIVTKEMFEAMEYKIER